MFSCNLPPALLAEWLGSFTCYCGNTGVEWIPKEFSTESRPWRRKFCHSCRNLNPQPFNSESGTLTTELSLPTLFNSSFIHLAWIGLVQLRWVSPTCCPRSCWVNIFPISLSLYSTPAVKGAIQYKKKNSQSSLFTTHHTSITHPFFFFFFFTVYNNHITCTCTIHARTGFCRILCVCVFLFFLSLPLFFFFLGGGGVLFAVVPFETGQGHQNRY